MTDQAPSTRRILFACVLVAVAALVSAGLANAQAPGPKNLQVLPKTMTKDQVKATMKNISKSLGVECDFCHDVPDMASDNNPHKKTAREMMKMSAEINAKWISKIAPKAEVTCNTCHRGRAKPEKEE